MQSGENAVVITLTTESEQISPEQAKKLKDKQARDNLVDSLRSSKIPLDKLGQLQQNLDTLSANELKINGKQIEIDGQILIHADMLATITPERAVKLSSLCKKLAGKQKLTNKDWDGLDASKGERLRFQYHLDMVPKFIENLGFKEEDVPEDLKNGDRAALTRFFDLVNDGFRTQDDKSFKDIEVQGDLKNANDFATGLNLNDARKQVEMVQFYTNFVKNRRLADSWQKQKDVSEKSKTFVDETKQNPIKGGLRVTLAELMLAKKDSDMLQALGVESIDDLATEYDKQVSQRFDQLMQATDGNEHDKARYAKMRNGSIKSDLIQTLMSGGEDREELVKMEIPALKEKLDKIDDKAFAAIQQRWLDKRKTEMAKDAASQIEDEWDQRLKELKKILSAPEDLEQIKKDVKKAYDELEQVTQDPNPVSIAVDDLWDSDAIITEVTGKAADLFFTSKSAAIYHAEKHFAELAETKFQEVTTFLNGRKPEQSSNKERQSASAYFAASFPAKDRLALYIDSARITIKKVKAPEVKPLQGGARLVSSTRDKMKTLVGVFEQKTASILTYMTAS